MVFGAKMIWFQIPAKVQFLFFEAWFSYRLNNKITLKMGRQQLSYDNQRILGRSDWGQQGLSHDAVRLQFKDTRLEFHTGWALNNTEESSDKKPMLPTIIKTYNTFGLIQMLHN